MEKLDTDEVKGFIDDEEFEKLCVDTNLNMSMEDIQAAMKYVYSIPFCLFSFCCFFFCFLSSE